LPILTEQERCGTQLAGKYRVEAVVGRGGMGVVFRATHLHTQRVVAIKILRPELSQDPLLGKRFVREARAATRLRHPNVVEVLDLGIEPDGTVYQVLELLEGEPLSGLLARKAPLPLEQTFEILMPVMNALAEAHAQGIVHRDLKPDNIFLSRAREGRVTPTLLDFGIAKLADAQGSFATNAGSVMGTPEYMAPEQARGGDDQGPALDVWAMGVIAHQCLTGRLPFEGNTPVLVLLKVMTEKAPRLDTPGSSVPTSIADVVERALQREQGDRFASVGEMLSAFRAAAQAAGVPTPPPWATTTGPLSAPPAPVAVEGEAETMGACDADRAEIAALASPLRARAATEASAPTALPAPALSAPERAPRPEVPPTLPMPRPRARHPALAAGLSAAAMGLIGLGAASWWTTRAGDAPPDTAGVTPARPARSVVVAPMVTASSTHAPPQPGEASTQTLSELPGSTGAASAAMAPMTVAPLTPRKASPRVGDTRGLSGAGSEPSTPAPPSVDAARPERRPGALPGVVSW